MISIYYDTKAYVCVSSNRFVGSWMSDIPSAIDDYRKHSYSNTAHSCFLKNPYTLIAQAPTIDDFYLNYPELFL